MELGQCKHPIQNHRQSHRAEIWWTCSQVHLLSLKTCNKIISSKAALHLSSSQVKVSNHSSNIRQTNLVYPLEISSQFSASNRLVAQICSEVWTWEDSISPNHRPSLTTCLVVWVWEGNSNRNSNRNSSSNIPKITFLEEWISAIRTISSQTKPFNRQINPTHSQRLICLVALIWLKVKLLLRLQILSLIHFLHSNKPCNRLRKHNKISSTSHRQTTSNSHSQKHHLRLKNNIQTTKVFSILTQWKKSKIKSTRLRLRRNNISSTIAERSTCYNPRSLKT